MKEALLKRIQKLEAAAPTPNRRVLRVIGSKAECDAEIAELIASGRASAADLFIARVIV